MFEKAEWIGCHRDMGDVCPEFMRRLEITGEVESAVFAVTAIGVYEAFVNGTRIGDFVLAPGCTVYRERLQYQEYDVKALLAKENCFTVTVGPGWHKGRISEGSKDINHMPGAMIASLTIVYKDGRKETIGTDGEWKVRNSRVLCSDLYDGETYDAAAPEGTYEDVKVLGDLGKERVIAQEGEKICEHERLKPLRYFVTPAGERVIDFGQNLAGYVELRVNAREGDRIVLSHGEILDREGNLYTENYRSAKAKLIYICKEGEQTYKPHLTFYGFRYIRLDEYPGTADQCAKEINEYPKAPDEYQKELDLNDFTAIALYSDMKRTGYVECGHKGINRLFENTIWSQRSNFIDIPTDCPQRDERMGWTGDAQVFCRTASYNYHVERFFRKWLADVRAEQYEDGMICDVVPNYWKMRRGSTAWGDVITIAPWQMYLTYGDKKVLEENYDAMKKWVDYITKDSHQPYLWTCEDSQKKLWGKHYGDWLAQDAPYGSYVGATDVDLVASAFYANSVDLLVKTGKVLGQDMGEYEELHQKIVETFCQTFELKTQTANVLALQFGLTQNRKETAARLAQMIRENGDRLQTGFVGTPYLLHVLSENGFQDVAYDLLLQEAFPSWLYEVNHGATTIWEHWDGVRDDGTVWSKDMNSYNHYAYGCVMDWIYGVAAGIQPMEKYPGFRKALISPVPDQRLGWLKASLETAYGVIRSSWVCQGDIVRYEISTPVDTIVIIDGKEYHVGKGDYIFYGKV